MKKVNLNELDLEKELNDILLDFNKELRTQLNEATKEITSDSVKKVRERSPKRTGKYAKGWTKTTSTKQDAVKGITFKTTDGIIYNKNKPQLTHLLEKGYTSRTGQRVSGKPHIEPTEIEAQEELYNRAIEIINNLN